MKIEGFRGSMEELDVHFELSRRLKVRIGALLALQISVSPTLLEMAGAGTPEERFLLDPRLLNRAKDLDKKAVQEIWGGEDCPLDVIQDSHGWRVLVLQEELLAQEGFSQEEQEEEKGDSLLPLVVQEEKEVRFQPLFSPKDLEKLKLEALTSADEKERIGALRKVIHSSLSLREKGLLLLHALEEDSPTIREEVAKGFEHLGFSKEISQTIKAFSTSYSSQQVYALQRLSEYIQNAPMAEVSLAFHFLRHVLETQELPHVVKAITKTLESVVARISETKPLIELAEQVIRLLPKNKERFEPFFHSLLIAMGKKVDKKEYESFFQNQLALTKSPFMATFLVLAMNEIELGDPSFRSLKLVELLQ
ncbi:MAG: hypothetical protein D6785_13340, partial [Planctomycetota bacterium]